MSATTPKTPAFEDACPPGCVEHYTAESGSRNHSTAPRYVTGESATREDHVVSVSTWMEQRHGTDGDVRAVGIVEKMTDDVELCPCQLRQLAKHLLRVAAQVEDATARRELLPAVVAAVSDSAGTTALQVRRSAIDGRSVHLDTGTSGEDLMLQPGDARRLGEALIRAAG